MNRKTKNKGLALQDVDPSFLPYACHLDHDTILTKNGNLLQTIKITGFNFELVGHAEVSLRKKIRAAIKNHIPDASYAIWIHTIRRKKDLSLKAEYDNKFCSSLNTAWETLHDWSGKYVNELFVTIISEGKAYRVSNIGNVIKSLNFTILRSIENKFIKKKLAEITEISNNILSDLEDFGAKRLGIFKLNGVYHSGILRFLGKIINLEEQETPIKEEDLSTQLPYCKIAFGKSMFEVSHNERKHYATIFSIKEYSEVSLKSLDKFLQLPIEFIITQTLDFVDSDEIVEEFQHQKKILEISNDHKFAKMSGIEEIISADEGKETDYGKQQLTVMLIADTPKELEQAIKKTTSVFFSFGLMIIREDIFMENCYWSQMPGNFFYLSRKRPINTSRIAGFASLSNFPAGKISQNKWGDAVSVFNTKNKTPYFFNFHLKDNGHTLIIGPYGTGKTVLLNFLLAQANKFKHRMIYLDFFNSSEIFIRALGGKYQNFSFKKPAKLFNPIKYANDPDFMRNFLLKLMIQKNEFSKSGYQAEQDKVNIIDVICAKISAGQLKIKQLSDLSSFFRESKYEKLFDLWHSEGKLAYFFDNQSSIMDNENIFALDISEIAAQKATLIPSLYFILHDIEQSLDGTPTILVMDEAFKLLDNPFFGPELNNFLTRMKEKNCVVILASESVEDAKNSSITNLLTKEIPTQFYLPNKEAGKEYKDIFKLSNQEAEMIHIISNDLRRFLIKHGNDAVIAELDLASLDHLISILSSNEYSIKIMNKVISEVGDDPNDWVPAFQDIISEIMEEEDQENYLEDLDDEEELDIDNYENVASQENREKLLAEASNDD